MTDDAARWAFVSLLRDKRQALRLSQTEVGRRVGVHGNTVGKWEAGLYWPTVAAAQLWARMLGVRVVGGDLADVFQADRGPAPASPPECGTPQGYRRHRKRGERCPPCWGAWSEYVAGLKTKRAA